MPEAGVLERGMSQTGSAGPEAFQTSVHDLPSVESHAVSPAARAVLPSLRLTMRRAVMVAGWGSLRMTHGDFSLRVWKAQSVSGPRTRSRWVSGVSYSQVLLMRTEALAEMRVPAGGGLAGEAMARRRRKTDGFTGGRMW